MSLNASKHNSRFTRECSGPKGPCILFVPTQTQGHAEAPACFLREELAAFEKSLQATGERVRLREPGRRDLEVWEAELKSRYHNG